MLSVGLGLAFAIFKEKIMKFLRNKVVVHVPASRIAKLTAEVEDLRHAAGGLTAVTGDGSWYNDAGRAVTEVVVVLTAYYHDDDRNAVDRGVRRLQEAMFRLGEESVLVEYGQAQAVLNDR